MNLKDWQKIKAGFNKAVEMTAGERDEFLRKEFNGNDDLRLEVEKMLGFDDEDSNNEDAFEKNAFQHFSGSDGSEIPKQIGNYKIIREIGRGGMGAVYEAVRETENFTQRVALKVIKRGMDTDAILSRFRHEQQILSSLEHPYIARFLDGGMTNGELPFYAMEFVEGEFIDDYSEAKNLSVRERLELFRKVCDAVQFAHQNLVVHRDLKPKNILVTKDGTPKLLDFGIGKIMTPESQGEIGTATQFGMMTPAYASPEQIRGERIGTQSDVYSLGVILFELLTGEKPYKTETNSQIEIQNAILETEPTKPSAIQSSKFKVQNFEKLNKDIDTIILKSLRKDPNGRYSSVQEFSEDIRRHLNGLPVYARPLTIKYRAAKFFKRNKVFVIAGVLVFLSLLTGITVSIWQAYEARKSAQIAHKRFEDVRQLANNVVFKYHDAIENLPGSTEVRKMLVTDALKYLDNLAENSEGNPELQKELARAYLKMGDVQGKMYSANIGDTKGAEESYKKAVDLMERAVGNDPKDIDAKEILIQAYDSFAFLTLRNATSDANSAKTIIRKAIRLHEQVIENEPNNDKRKIQLIELLVRLGDIDIGDVDDPIRVERGQNFEVRLSHHLKALPFATALYESDMNDYEKLKTLARVYQRIGADYFWIGEQAEDFREAEKALLVFPKALKFDTQFLEMVKKMKEINPENSMTQRYLSAAYSSMARSLMVNGKFAKAGEMADKNLEIAKKTFEEDGVNKEARLGISIAYEIISEIHARKKDYKKAVEYRLKSLEIDQKIFGEDEENREVLQRANIHHQKLSELFIALKEEKKARFHQRESERLEKSENRSSEERIKKE